MQTMLADMMYISHEWGGLAVRWPALELTMMIDPGRAWLVLHGRVIGNVVVGAA